MSKSITSLLGIQGWFKVEDIREEQRTIHLYLMQLRKTADCPRCKKRTKSGYDKQPTRTFLHTTIGTKLVFLHISPRRFVCSCTPSKPFREELPVSNGRRTTTPSFDKEILRHLSGQSFKTVERKFALSYPALRVRLLEAVDPSVIRWDLVDNLSEIHLGLDSYHLVNKRFCETIAEVKQRIPLGILPNSKNVTVYSALKTMPERLRLNVKSVSLDMNEGTVVVVEKVFPNAAIVIDHFHVIQDANRRLSQTRLIEQEIINQQKARKGIGRTEIPGQLLRLAKEHLNQDRKEPERLVILLNQYPRLKV